MTLHRLCGTDELADGQARRFVVADQPIALVHLLGEWFAIGDTCSHADVSLSEGEVVIEDCALECWKHGSAFDLRTGQPLTLPATQPVPRYEVVVAGTDVLVELDQ